MTKLPIFRTFRSWAAVAGENSSKKWARGIAVAVFVLLSLVFIGGCGSSSATQTQSAPQPTATPTPSPTPGLGGATAVLTFPVPVYLGKSMNAHNAPIVTVFDHHFQRPYGNDGTIIDVTGNLADQDHCTVPGASNVLGRASGKPFDLGAVGNYVGFSPCGGTARLSYDDHPGYDYAFAYDTPIFPAIHGRVTYATKPNGVNTQDASVYHTLTIVSDDGSNLEVRYLHLATWWDATTETVRHRNSDGTEEECTTCAHEGDIVDPKQTNPIGYTGNFSFTWGGVGPHLHFEVSDLNRNPIDPYGWLGNGPDPCSCGQNLWDVATTTPIAAFSISGGGQTFKNGDSANFQVPPGGTVNFTFDGSASIPEAGTITNFNWTVGTQSHTGPSFSLALGAGTYTVTLTVINSTGGTNTATANITITVTAGTPPVASISSPQQNGVFAGGESISFNGSATDTIDGSLTGAALVWSDSLLGQIGTGNAFSRSDLPPGLQTVTLTATDSQGRSASTSVTITISSGTKTLAGGLSHPWAITIDNQSVFWTENNVLNGAIKSVPKAGGPVTTLATDVEPVAIAVDSSNVYWIARNNGDNGSIKSVPKVGGIPVVLVQGLHNAQNFLAADDQYLYFGDGLVGGGGAIRKVPKTGGPVVTLVNSGLPNLNTAIAVDATFVYFGDGVGHLLRVDKNGGTVSVVANANPSAIVVNNGVLYWTDSNLNRIQSVSTLGGVVQTLSTDTTGPSNLAVDGFSVFWIEFNFPGAVKSVPLTGGTAVVYATQANTIGIALDATNVYWAESTIVNQGKINSHPK